MDTSPLPPTIQTLSQDTPDTNAAIFCIRMEPQYQGSADTQAQPIVTSFLYDQITN